MKRYRLTHYLWNDGSETLKLSDPKAPILPTSDKVKVTSVVTFLPADFQPTENVLFIYGGDNE